MANIQCFSRVGREKNDILVVLSTILQDISLKAQDPATYLLQEAIKTQFVK